MEQLYRAFNANTMYGIRMAMGAGHALNTESMDFVQTISVPTEKGETNERITFTLDHSRGGYDRLYLLCFA